MSKVLYEVTHGNGTYKAQDGSEKTRWQRIGTVFQSDKGNVTMKLEPSPTRRNAEGERWDNQYVPKTREDHPHAQGFTDQPPAVAHGVGNDDIPF